MTTFKKVLVTGGAGFIGSHMTDLLLARGYQVRVYDNLEPQVHGAITTPPQYLSKDAEFIHGDILDQDSLRRALEGCDAVIHDAAMVGVGQSQYQIERYTKVNTLGTAILLDILANSKTSVERLMVASSMSIYGEGLYQRPSDGKIVAPELRPDAQLQKGVFDMLDPETGERLDAVPTPESKNLYCQSVYALTKKDQEELCLITGRAHNLSTIACRFFNVYGPRQSLSNPYTGAAAIFMSRIKNNNRPLIYEDGKQLRDFISVHDLVDAKLFLLENPKANLDTYNICTGKATSIKEVAEILSKIYGRPDLAPDVTSRYRSGDIRHCYGDPAKINGLGWQAKTSVTEGLTELVEWSREVEASDKLEAAQVELQQRGLVKG